MNNTRCSRIFVVQHLKIVVVLLLWVCFILQPTKSEPLSGKTCDVRIYKDFTSDPIVKQDSRDTCPVGNGPRAFVEVAIQGAFSSGHPHHGPETQKMLKEVAPEPGQTFHCLPNRKCYLVVRGFGMASADALVVLPAGETNCPPTGRLTAEAEAAQDVPIVVRAEKAARLASTRFPIPIASFAAFQLPERFTLAPGTHTLCYAPVLADPGKAEQQLDYLNQQNFHYTAGTLEISTNVLQCSFEEQAHYFDDDAFGDPALPCGFRNFRDQFYVDLVWQIGQNETETPGTGPHSDATPGLQGQGHYLYMDSPGYSLGAAATVVSPPVAFPPGGYCAQFSYHMHGADVATLRTYVHEVHLHNENPSGFKLDASDDLLGDWGSPKWVAVGNKGDVWHAGGFEFLARDMQTYQLVFEALAGRSEEADIAIDDVKITPGRCPADIKHHFPKTLSGLDGTSTEAPMVCGEVRLKTGLHSSDKAWHVEGAVSCAGKGYSLDYLNNTAWVPCCVPHFGVYKLVLEDAFGDGWTGSTLEFRFFDRVMVFGNDDFAREGYHKHYNLVIGALEITDVQKPTETSLSVSVRAARPRSYVWCGVVKAGKHGRPLAVNFGPETLKRYGVRSTRRSVRANEILNVVIHDVLKSNTAYDLYCYSEVVGAEPDRTEEKQEQVRKEILASRMRVSTDRSPPHVTIVDTEATFNTINATVVVDESSVLWCLAEKALPTTPAAHGVSSDAAATTATTIYTQLTPAATDSELAARLIERFKEVGTEMEITIPEGHGPAKQSIIIAGLVANNRYHVFCYAEDMASPKSNAMRPDQIADTMKLVKTSAKVPSVTIVRRITELRGFRLFVKADAPGRVWCAAAPVDYGTPRVADVQRVGATVDITDPNEEGKLDVRGVDQNTAYMLYCIGGLLGDNGDVKMTSSESEMEKTAVRVVSYGRYCEADPSDPVTVTEERTPFHPITPAEELAVRDFILAQQELHLDGVYRINILPNKTETYDYYDKGGPKPLRYARVRAGRCENKVGYYEQLRVGPLEHPEAMSYVRIARPVETECGGYNPQGVFGRRLLEATSTDLAAFNRFLLESFGHEFETEACKASEQRKESERSTQCLSLGPLILEDACPDDNDEHTLPKNDTTCSAGNRGGRIWVGLRTSTGDRLPFYFLHNVSEALHTRINEQPQDWARRVIHEGQIPEGFDAIIQATEVWYEGKTYPSIDAVLKDTDAPRYTPQTFEDRRRRLQEQLLQEGRRQQQRRRLDPQPFAGAAGTAGPLPSRQTRRGDLEYRAIPEHAEPQGKRFTVEAADDQEAFTIRYIGWSMTVTNDRDTALKVYNLRFLGKRVAFELGVMEALAHYSVSERNWFFLDSWYGGLGAAARRVHKGIECPKTAVSLFFDGSLCVFEQDMARPIRAHWKSGEIRDGAPHTALVLRQMLTVSNYDYVTDYRFHSTGMFEGTMAFTGELYAGIEVPWYSARQQDYGVQVTGAMRFAALHSHMAVWKIDFDVGEGDNWKANSVLLTEVIPDPKRHGANKLRRTLVDTELQAAHFRNDSRALVYEVVDETIRIFGNLGGYRVIPAPGVNPLHHEFELYMGPAAWAKYRAATTVRKYSELDSTLPRDNKYAKKPAVSLDRYILDNEPVRNVDVVTWIADGIFHLPVVEDMPLTVPIGNTLGWLVKPANMFFEDPSMDLNNAMGGGVEDPGTCAVMRLDIGEVEPVLDGTWRRPGAPPVRITA